MAEGVGFEPTVGFPTPVFKTGAIDHSTTPPERSMRERYDLLTAEVQAKLSTVVDSLKSLRITQTHQSLSPSVDLAELAFAAHWVA